MKRATTPLIIALIVTFIAAYYINDRVCKGAQMGGEGISKQHTLQAQLDPDKFYWQMYPASLLFGSGIGLVVFIIGFFVSPSKPKEQV